MFTEESILFLKHSVLLNEMTCCTSRRDLAGRGEFSVLSVRASLAFKAQHSLQRAVPRGAGISQDLTVVCTGSSHVLLRE